jgi:riboflavin kinase/FMN adenylyltransferase
MNIIRRATDLRAGTRSVCVAIGFFDGVHLGHQQVIRHALGDAQAVGGLAVVVTFDCHPSTVLAPARAPRLIYPLTKKLELCESMGVDSVLLLHFDRAFSEQAAEAFVRGLARDLAPLRSASVGSTFTFGYQRQGNLALLQSLGSQLAFEVHGVEVLAAGGKTVSSTRIRDAIQAGDFAIAGQMLGRPYALTGKVVAGDQLGRQLGFPTANIETTGLVLPPRGVYVVQAAVKDQTHGAVLNIGVRPTLGQASPPVQVEAHLLDFNGDLYGADLELVFVRRLRDEKKFPSRAALQEQISADITQARNCLAGR